MSSELEFPGSLPPVSTGGSTSGAARGLSQSGDLLSLRLDGNRIHVGFIDKGIPDETRVVEFQRLVNQFIARTGIRKLVFDLDGLKLLPSRMLGFFLSLRNEGNEIELENVTPLIEDIFRVTKLAPLVTIRLK